MNTPALPPACMCRHSSSMMKFSYIRSVRIVPVGLPVLTIMPSLTVNVSGATLTLTQPDRSLPLKSGFQLSCRRGSSRGQNRREVGANESELKAAEHGEVP